MLSQIDPTVNVFAFFIDITDIFMFRQRVLTLSPSGKQIEGKYGENVDCSLPSA